MLVGQSRRRILNKHADIGVAVQEAVSLLTRIVKERQVQRFYMS